MMSVSNSNTIQLYFIDGYRDFARNYSLKTEIQWEGVFLGLI